MAVGSRESDDLWLKQNHLLDDAVQRAANRVIEPVWRRAEPVLWTHDEGQASNILDEDQRYVHQLARDAERTRQRQQWKAQSIRTLVRDPQYAEVLRAEAARHGDRELPASMQKAPPPTEMQRLYASFEGQHHDAEMEPPPTYSRLQLKDEPSIVMDDRPRRGGGLTFSKTPQLVAEQSPSRLALRTEKPQQTPAPNKENLLSMSALSRKLLPREMWIEERTSVPSKTVSMPARKGVW